MKKGNTWQLHEDQAFLEIYIGKGIEKWREVSFILAQQYGIRKSPKQCRQRYKNHLDPSINEKTTLLELHSQIGNRWADISRALPGRTDNSVKNKLYSIFRHSISDINSLIKSKKSLRWKQLTMGFIFKLIALVDSKFKLNSHLPHETIRRAQELKHKILEFEGPSGILDGFSEQKLCELMTIVQFINLQFKKKAVKVQRGKSSSLVQKSSRTKQNNQPTDYRQGQQEKQNSSNNQQPKAGPIKQEECLLVVPFSTEKICIGKTAFEDDENWQAGWNSDESQAWGGNRWLYRFQQQPF